MSSLLFFDTETTGLPDWHKPSDSPQQPYIVQIAGLITDEGGKKQGYFDTLIKPAGWTIDAKLTAIHGITTEMCEEFGLPIDAVLRFFLSIVGSSKQVIGHNVAFDKRMVRIMMKRLGWTEEMENWKNVNSFCTQSNSRKLVQAAPTEAMLRAGRKHSKAPTLAEAFEHFTGNTYERGHVAGRDAQACRTVYLGIIGANGGIQPAAPKAAPKAQAKAAPASVEAKQTAAPTAPAAPAEPAPSLDLTGDVDPDVF